MSAYRCSQCDLDWPPEPVYSSCPQCKSVTAHMGQVTPMNGSEALSLLKHAEFDRYCERRDERLAAEWAAQAEEIANLPEAA